MLMSAETNGGDTLEPPDAPGRPGAHGRDWQSSVHSVHVHMPAGDLLPPVHSAIAELIHPNAIK